MSKFPASPRQRSAVTVTTIAVAVAAFAAGCGSTASKAAHAAPTTTAHPATATTTVAAAATLSWSPPPATVGTPPTSTATNPARPSMPTAMSCADGYYCLAVTEDGTATLNSSGSSRTGANKINGASYSGTVTSVSCPVAGSCLAVGTLTNSANPSPPEPIAFGWYTEGADNGWIDSPNYFFGGHPPAGYQPIAVSCSGQRFCMTVGSASGTGASAQDSGNKWDTSSLAIPGSGKLTLLSCSSPSFCVASDGTANTWQYSGTAWTETAVPGAGQIVSLSCPTDQFCAAASSAGVFFRNGSGMWAKTGGLPAAFSPTAISCSSGSFCLAAGSGGSQSSYFYDGSRWQATKNSPPGLTVPQCVASECFAYVNTVLGAEFLTATA